MQSPNLMVEYSATDLADLVAATSFHVGEVKRNPYHLLLPAWMQDNVRRGAELVGGQGGAAPTFMFAQLFRAQKWDGAELQTLLCGWPFPFLNQSTLERFSHKLTAIVRIFFRVRENSFRSTSADRAGMCKASRNAGGLPPDSATPVPPANRSP